MECAFIDIYIIYSLKSIYIIKVSLKSIDIAWMFRGQMNADIKTITTAEKVKIMKHC